MKIKLLIISLLSSLALYVSPVLAAFQNATYGNSLTMMGPLALQIDLGIGNVPGLSLAQVVFYYNVISAGLILWVAFVADEESSTTYCVVITGIAAFVAWAGWFRTPSPSGQWGLIILCALLSIAMYMTEKKRRVYGVSGGGDPMLNVVLFLILFQGTVGLINGAGIFPVGTTAPTPSICGNSTYSSCQINGNVQLANANTNTGTSGISSVATDITTSVVLWGWNAMMLVIQIAVSVFAFSYVITTIYPWITLSAPALLLLGLFQAGIWFTYSLAFWRWGWKPMPGDGKV